MRKAYILLILGIWLAILPFLGFPYSWKDNLVAITGLGLVYISFVLYRESKAKADIKEKTFDNFSENSFEDVRNDGAAN